MKPFDIEKAKAGAQVVTRYGKPVRIVCFDRKEWCGKTSIVALVTYQGNYEALLDYSLDGKVANAPAPHDCDLFMATVKREGWVNVYPDTPGAGGVLGAAGSYVYATEREAQLTASVRPGVKQVKVEWEE